MKRFHLLETKKKRILTWGFAKKILKCNDKLHNYYLVFCLGCSRFGGRGNKALRESLNLPVF